MRFRDKLVRACDKRGWSQADLWREIGKAVSKNTVSRWWKGEAEPWDDSAVRLARALRVSLDYLADDELDEEPRTAVEPAINPEDRVVLEVVHALGLSPDEVIRRLYLEIRPASPPDGEARGERQSAR